MWSKPADSGSEVKLLGFWVSPFVRRVEWALKLKGVDFEYIEEDIFNKSPLLLKLNPVGRKVPVLVHRGRPIAESFIILEYIDEAWNQAPLLLPQDPHQRAVARFWAQFAEHKLLEASFNGLASEGAAQEEAVSVAIEALEKMEGELGKRGGRFFGGESIGYLDIAVGWIAYWLPVIEEVGQMRILDPHKFPLVSSWAESFLNHPAIKDSLPPRDKMLHYFHTRRTLLTSASHGRITV